MLKRRLIPKLQLGLRTTFRGAQPVLVVTRQFSNRRAIGNPLSQAKIYESQLVDELILVDLERTEESWFVLLNTVEALAEALEWSGLTEIAKNQAKTLSGGVQQRVAFTRAWILKPKVLLLDEPMSNMDDESREKTCHLLNKMKKEGLSIVITSHITENIEELVNNNYYLSEGNIKEGKTF